MVNPTDSNLCMETRFQYRHMKLFVILFFPSIGRNCYVNIEPKSSYQRKILGKYF